MKTISWVQSTRSEWQLGHIRRFKLIFAQNVSELAFCFPKEKIELFFKNRKLTSTRLRLINRYYESKVHTLKMFLSYYYLLFLTQSCGKIKSKRLKIATLKFENHDIYTKYKKTKQFPWDELSIQFVSNIQTNLPQNFCSARQIQEWIDTATAQQSKKTYCLHNFCFQIFCKIKSCQNFLLFPADSHWCQPTNEEPSASVNIVK